MNSADSTAFISKLWQQSEEVPDNQPMVLHLLPELELQMRSNLLRQDLQLVEAEILELRKRKAQLLQRLWELEQLMLKPADKSERHLSPVAMLSAQK